MFAGENGGVSSVACTDFPENSLRMDLDRRLADCEAAGNLFIGQTIAQATQDLLFPLRQKIMKNPADTGLGRRPDAVRGHIFFTCRS